jgi:hypothetical protein
VRFSYDPLGKRVEKVARSVTATYTYDDEDVLREVRGGTTLKYVLAKAWMNLSWLTTEPHSPTFTLTHSEVP